MRRILVMAAVVVAAVALVGSALVPAGAGVEEAIDMIVVRKTVQGSATGGFTVIVSCEAQELSATLSFDSTGAPTTFTGIADWSIVDGDWKLNFETPPNEPVPCTATETDADGAPTTTWTCAYEAVVEAPPPGVGCDTPSGTGTGPVGFTLGSTRQGIQRQMATVHLTNTVPAPAVEAAPTFTG